MQFHWPISLCSLLKGYKRRITIQIFNRQLHPLLEWGSGQRNEIDSLFSGKCVKNTVPILVQSFFSIFPPSNIVHGDFPNVSYFLTLTFSESNARAGKSDNFHLPDEVQLFSNGRPDLYFSGRFVKFSKALVKTFPDDYFRLGVSTTRWTKLFFGMSSSQQRRMLWGPF